MKSNDGHPHSQITLSGFVLSPLTDISPCRFQQKSHFPKHLERTLIKLWIEYALWLTTRWKEILEEISSKECHKKGLYLKSSSHISVIKVSPGNMCKRNLPVMLLIKFGSPLQIHLMIALTANPSVHNPCKIGRENLWQCVRTKLDKHKTLGCIWISHDSKIKSRSLNASKCSIYGEPW